MRAVLLASASLLPLTACLFDGEADDKAPGTWTPGKGDGSFELVEAGPAPVGGSVDLSLAGRIPAYRIESYGGTRLAIDVKGRAGTDAYVIVEGPLAGDGDRIAVGGGAVFAEDDDSGYGRNAKLAVELPPGVYRILAGTYESLGLGGDASGQISLSVTCTAGCFRPMVDQKNFVRALQAQGGPAFAAYAHGELAKLIPDADVAAQLGAQLDAILADPELRGLERFPTLPLAAIGALRPALGALPATPPSEDQIVRGELMQLLGACSPERALPAELDGAQLPGVRYGQFPSRTLSPCQFAHAGKLAQVLTSLAAQNGSEVTFKGKTITSPRELFAALVASGHTVDVRNERMYANFLSMIAGDRDVIWPVWLDTGIALSSGESLSIPVGHSHHAWRIRGPNVDTRVMFYLGVSGAGFFGQTDQRPAWSGMITSSEVTIASASGADYAYLLQTADLAAAYLRRIRTERETVAAGRPADGYGFLGVCNDSNAALEHATRGTISTFPLLRAKQLDAQADLGDGLDATLRALPKDGDGLVDPRDALRRAVAMQPFPSGSPLMWDAKLGAQLQTARADLGQ
jgi:hypothetical protein